MSELALRLEGLPWLLLPQTRLYCCSGIHIQMRPQLELGRISFSWELLLTKRKFTDINLTKPSERVSVLAQRQATRITFPD